MASIIGVDFDNTLISYDEVFYQVALSQGLLFPGVMKSKKDIRDLIRSLPDGEIAWQKVQAIVYGLGLREARLMDGVPQFFKMCRRANLAVYIVSHKTRFAKMDDTGTDLRTAALSWMEQHGFFAASGLGLSPEAVFFESTRKEKIGRIKQLGCTLFIDDLEETFLDDTFPADVRKILFSPHRRESGVPGVKIFSSWADICHYLFHAKK